MNYRNCILCGQAIPVMRKSSAKYCSEECYYEQKKERSRKAYQKMMNSYGLAKKNEQILAFLMNDKTELQTTAEILHKLGFEMGFSERQVKGTEGNIWRSIGCYYYTIDENRMVSICKIPLQN